MNNEKKEVKLINKVKRLLRHLGMPRWLHRFGPKKYEFYEHLCVLFMKSFCRLSYRRIVKHHDLLGLRCPSKSALQYTAKKLSTEFFEKALRLTSGSAHHIVAIDGTGYSRTNPSYHYLKRIDGKWPKIPVKLSAALDTKTKKWCAAKVRVLPAHDIKDAKYLISKVNTRKIVADKAYDANWLHEFMHHRKIEAHIPKRDFGKPRHSRWNYRNKSVKTFRMRTYHRRPMVESGFHSMKSKFGASVSSKFSKTIKTELYLRLVAHNIFHMLCGTLRTEPIAKKTL